MELTNIDDRKKILIIDDDPTYARMVFGWLKEDYRVTMAVKPDQAFKYLAGNIPDLILLDYEMPEMPGPVLYERIKTNSVLDDVPIVFLTGKNDRESIMRILSLNPRDYILKSLTKEEILPKIAEYIV
ncbi:MAG: response regulator [Lachnospiraceae bacterium]|nr:response regulator [Lachnospiraceae bacterium]